MKKLFRESVVISKVCFILDAVKVDWPSGESFRCCRGRSIER